MFHGAEARAPNAALLAASGRVRATGGLARWWPQRDSALQRRRRPSGHRRPHQTHQFHRQRACRLGHQAARRKKESRSRIGGNAAVIVHSDADLEYAAERCVSGGFGYAGQTCISVQRILVEHSVYGKFTDLFVEGVKKLKIGDPLDESTDVGPLIRESDAIRTTAWIDEAVRAGARLLCGGGRKNLIVEPTVLTGTKPDMKVNCQEVFGPVVTVEPYKDFDQALRQVNHSAYGMQAGIFTRDAKLMFQAYEELEVGGVIAGDVPSFRIDQMPYGGVKDSGFGREGLRYAIEEMTEPKLMVMNLR